MKVKDVIQEYKVALKDLYSEGELSQVIFLVFEFVKHFSKIDLVVKNDEIISADEKKKFDEILAQLIKNKPVQYVLGYSGFSGMKLKVNEHVLIPRQETEELVKWIIDESVHSVLNTQYSVLDVCTGSGCIALALKKEMPNAEVFSLDVSEEALAIAKENSQSNNLKINFTQADILQTPLSDLKTKFDLIVSNPPYVLEREKLLMDTKVLNYEPHLALFVEDTDPLIFYKAISDFAIHHLKPGGKLYFEINETKGKAVAELLSSKGFSEVEVKKDLNGKDRMVRAVRM